jgi:sporulation protein YlmC with PRC-barrel domain
MKKISILLSVFVMISLLLAACGQNNNDFFIEQTPDADITPLPETTPAGEDDLTTPEAEEPLDPAETPDADLGVDAEVTPTPMDEADDAITPTPTMEGETDTEGQIPPTGQEPGFGDDAFHQFFLMSEFVGMEVQASNGQTIGRVTGLIIDRPLQDGVDGFGNGGALMTATPTPDAAAQPGTGTDDDATVEPALTPEVDNGGAALPGDDFAMQDNPRIVYLLVDVTGDEMFGEETPQPGVGDDTGATLITPTPQTFGDTGTSPFAQQMGDYVLIPWYAFDFSGIAMDVLGESDRGQFFGSGNDTLTPTPGTDDLTITPTPGLSTDDDYTDLTMTPTPVIGTDDDNQVGGGLGFTPENRVLVLNVDADVVATAPTFNQITTGGVRMPGWDAQLIQHWSQYGVGEPVDEEGIPGTGVAPVQTGEIVLVSEQMQVFDLTDAAGQTIGQIEDFVVDLRTGELVYAVLTGQGQLEGRMYLMPFNHLTWQSDRMPGGDGFADFGSFTTDFPDGSFESVPDLQRTPTPDNDQ